MPHRTKLGDLERAVMQTLWDSGEDWRTVREVHEALAADRDIAYTTVMTVLGRMAAKDLVEQQKDGRAYTYRPAASRGSMTAEVMRDALGEFSESDQTDRSAALIAFVGQASEDDRQALRDALAELDRREGS